MAYRLLPASMRLQIVAGACGAADGLESTTLPAYKRKLLSRGMERFTTQVTLASAHYLLCFERKHPDGLLLQGRSTHAIIRGFRI